MKILRHGTADPTSTQIICEVDCACGCIFTFTKDEPLIQCETYPSGFKRYFICCPECGNAFHLRESFLR